MTLSQLTELTGRTYRTVKGRLGKAGVKPMRQDGTGTYYAPPEALAAIYHVGGGKELDLSAERARLARAQAEKVERENAAHRRELVPVAEAVGLLQRVITGARARILTIPVKAAPRVRGKRKLRAVQRVLQEVTDEALHELASMDPAALAAPTEPPEKQHDAQA